MKAKKKILTVVGARPQFIKAATVSRELSGHEDVREILLHTGQHYDDNMSEVFFREMEIPKPAYNLAVHESLHGAMTAAMLRGIEEIILKEKPDAVLVYGDTNSTIAGALASKKLLVKLVHVEAGLRSRNMKMPEEINRILTDRISDVLCCPTENAMRNLRLEGFDHFDCSFMNTGDVMYDASLYYASKSEAHAAILDKVGRGPFILCTVHRAENTNEADRLRQIMSALNTINKDIPVIFPMHPRTKKRIDSLGIQTQFTILEPVGYFDMLGLLKHCRLVITDSGGLQKEAYFFKKHCICVRDETEWTELKEAGYVRLASGITDRIVEAFHQVDQMPAGFAENFFGDGHAAVKIAEQLLKI